jgi:uncharacterized protein
MTARGRPFLVSVTNLAQHGRKEVVRSGPIAGLEVTGSRVPPGAEVQVAATLEAVHGGIMVSAVVDAPWAGECRRCLGPAEGSLRVEVRELYERHSSGEETYPFDGDQLDLEPLARDAVLLELPQAPLCTEDCLGLCPRCGVDLNRSPCNCPPETDPRWAALDSLRQPLEGGADS